MVQQHSVEADVRHGIHALKAQYLMGAVHNPLLRSERLRIQVVVLHQSKGFQLVVTVVGIFHFSRRQQVGVNGPGHLGRDLLSLTGRGQRPLFSQLLYDHKFPPSGRAGSSRFFDPNGPLHHSSTAYGNVNGRFLLFSSHRRWIDSARWNRGSIPLPAARKPPPWQPHTDAAGSRTVPKAPPWNVPGPS
ncbi:unknown [Clostridium sp. CAG:1013]|nr:unknown [Clostridium sp. CAG:1013]